METTHKVKDALGSTCNQCSQRYNGKCMMGLPSKSAHERACRDTTTHGWNACIGHTPLNQFGKARYRRIFGRPTEIALRIV